METLLSVTRAEPRYWEAYHTGTEAEIEYALTYSLSDRIRNYWSHPGIAASVSRLMSNLESAGIPLVFSSRFFPDFAETVSEDAGPKALVRGRINRVNTAYPDATHPRARA